MFVHVTGDVGSFVHHGRWLCDSHQHRAKLREASIRDMKHSYRLDTQDERNANWHQLTIPSLG